MDSLCCTAEANTTLKINYPPLRINLKTKLKKNVCFYSNNKKNKPKQACLLKAVWMDTLSTEYYGQVVDYWSASFSSLDYSDFLI